MEPGPIDLPSRTTTWLCNSVYRVLLSGATLVVSPIPLEDALETQHCSNATKCQCLPNFDKLLHALAKVLRLGVAVQSLPESLQDEDHSVLDRVVLFPRLPRGLL